MKNREQGGGNNPESSSIWENMDVKSAEKQKEKSELVDQKTLDYFKNNPKELSRLAAEIVKMRPEKDDATWDKEQRAYIGADGLPRDYAHLVGYLKKNPDTIKTAIETYQDLQEKGTDDKKTEKIEDSIIEKPATSEKPKTEEIPLEAAEDKRVLKAPEKRIFTKNIELLPKETQKRVTDIQRRIEYATEHSALSASETIWTEIESLKDDSSEAVQNIYKSRALHERIRDRNALIIRQKAKLEKMPFITMPWTQAGKEKRQVRHLIRDAKANIKENKARIDEIDKFYKENPSSKSDQALVRVIDLLEERRKPIDTKHAYMEAILKKKQLAKCQEMLAQPNEVRNASLRVNELPKTDKWLQNRIYDLQTQIFHLEKSVSDYQKANPDFVLMTPDLQKWTQTQMPGQKVEAA